MSSLTENNTFPPAIESGLAPLVALGRPDDYLPPSGALREYATDQIWQERDLLKPHLTKVVVCIPRKNALLKDGNKGDKIDARKLSELLRLNHLKPVYHGEHGIRALKESGRSH